MLAAFNMKANLYFLGPFRFVSLKAVGDWDLGMELGEAKAHYTLCVCVCVCVCVHACSHEADVMLDLAGWTTTFSNSCLL